MAEKIMLIDGNSIINRAFYGIPILTNSEGVYTNAVYGFFNIIIKMAEEEKPDYMCVAFDLPSPTFRHSQYSEYKGNRKGMPDELGQQLPLLKEALSAMNISMFSLEGYEADDILGTLCEKAVNKNIIPIIVSGDRDLLQLASKEVKVKVPKTYKNSTTVEDYFEADVIAKYGVTPKEFIDLKALMGDASDNIPGVAGIGEKTATKIIQQYHSVENAIEHSDAITPKRASTSIAENKDIALLSKKLVTIDKNAPIEFKPEENKFSLKLTPKAYDIFKRLEFKSLIERLTQNNEEASHDVISYDIDVNIMKPEEFFENVKGGLWSYEIKSENGIVFLAAYNCENGAYYTEGDGIFNYGGSFFGTETKKIGHDIKSDIGLLRKNGIELEGVIFDTAIAGYVINPTKDTYDYNDLAAEFLGVSYPSSIELFGKGKSRQTVDSIDIEQRAKYMARQSQVYFESKPIMDKKLLSNGQENLFYNIEMPLIYVLADMEKYGIKINKYELEKYGQALQISIDNTTKEIYNLAGEEFNINSPKQLGIVLFEKLGLPGGKKTKTGGYSTNAEILEKLKTESPIVDKILFYRQIAKLKSTYADGLLSVMDKYTNRIYSTFNQTITATGRISSTEPNLQNIPVRLELGRELRRVFIPENDDFIFMDADYSQIELRVLAHMSDDDTLINAFKTGQDIHRLTASQVFNIPFDEVTSYQRSNAKAVNFGIVYGIGAFSLSEDLGISFSEAKSYIDGYFAKYPNIKKYMDNTISEARKNGYVSTIFGRRRYMPELASKNPAQRSFGERVAMNMPIQGSAADIIKIAMIKVYNALKDNNLKSRLILQVHDELLLEVHKDEEETVRKLLKENMENAANLSTPMDVDIHTGRSWFDSK